MMHKLIAPFLISVLLISCSNEPTITQENETETTSNLPLLDTNENGIFKEWYEGHKQVKIKGLLDENNERHGVWKFFDTNGDERNITTYKHGKKHGHIVVYFPNGMLKYKGEYDMDSTVGEWKFYEADGSIAKIINYDEKK